MEQSNPSNPLYNGEVNTLQEAFRLMILQYRREQQWIRHKDIQEFHEDGQQGLKDLEQSITSVKQCQSEYEAVIHTASLALFEAWKNSTNKDIARIGEAAILGDYSLLAL